MKHLSGLQAYQWQVHQIKSAGKLTSKRKKKAHTSGCVRQENDMQRQLGRCSD